MEDRQIYVVKGKKQETHDTATLLLAYADGSIPSFVPGQFISIYFPELNTPEGKSYSISNPPGEKTFNITVKGIGEFSNRLCAIEPGNIVLGSLPYGFFFSEQDDTNLVMIAGGIGITPFRSVILNAGIQTPERKLSLFQSTRTVADLLFFSELSHKEGLVTNYFITREQQPCVRAVTRRVSAKDILENCNVEHSEFFICGSISFVRNIWKDLKRCGIDESKICTEAFF